MRATVENFERLGVFYLGKRFDQKTNSVSDDLILYDSRDLVTHALCVGMTGSGKTGLCLTLLEEAAIDGIPALVIDPKGDLSNLLLTFPDLKPEDFAPWVNADDAERKGITVEEFAKEQAELWKKGIAQWGQDGARIQRLRDSADFAVYTPGASAGIPLSILSSFAPPAADVLDDRDLLRDQLGSASASLLALLGVGGDDMGGREHILLCAIFENAWREGRTVDLATLVHEIQSPSVDRVGVMELESFFPAKERFELAMKLNNLLASPGFSTWLDGEPLDIGQLLRTPRGKPRVSIFSIAHLADRERMFFVSLFLQQVLSWTRSQPGTSSLRALVYMDEIAGYFPPIANPPSKAPLLTLLKQARAFGVGVVLATQNPIDLDYKGLSNCGTWFIGRLQTERDKARVLEGLESAAGNKSGFDRAAIDRAISSLSQRVFLMNSIHEDGPDLFQVRWALCYLRGPLTRAQLKALTAARRSETTSPATTKEGPAKSPVVESSTASVNNRSRPLLPPDIAQFFAPTIKPASGEVVYQPALVGFAKIHFVDAKRQVDLVRDLALVLEVMEQAIAIDWDRAALEEWTTEELEREPIEPAAFASLPSELSKPRNYPTWKKSMAAALARSQTLSLFRCAPLKLTSNPDESEREFAQRVQTALAEARDQVKDKLEKKYGPKLATLVERVRKAEQALQREQEQASSQKWQSVLSIGTSILGAFLGKKAISVTNVGRATTAARTASKTYKETMDVARARETIDALKKQHEELEAAFQADLEKESAKIELPADAVEAVPIRPKKSNVEVSALVFVWLPYDNAPTGRVPLWMEPK